MAYFLVGGSLILALAALLRGGTIELTDAMHYFLYPLAYGFTPAAIGYATALLVRLTGKSQTPEDFVSDRNRAWIIFLAILSAGQMVRGISL